MLKFLFIAAFLMIYWTVKDLTGYCAIERLFRIEEKCIVRLIIVITPLPTLIEETRANDQDKRINRMSYQIAILSQELERQRHSWEDKPD